MSSELNQIETGSGLLAGKVVFLVGVGPLMGQAVARTAAKEGARVAIAARSMNVIAPLADEINAAGGEALSISVDVTDESTIVAAVEQVSDTMGPITGVFYNAPFYDHAHDGLDIDPALWKTTLDINLMGAISTAKHTVPGMIAAGGGSLVFNSSAAGMYADGVRLGYSVAKAGLDAVVRHIARRYGIDNVRANSLYPFVLPDEVPEQIAPGFTGLTCLRRSGTPEEVANAATFLLSERSSFITGEGVHVDGGLFRRAHWPEMG